MNTFRKEYFNDNYYFLIEGNGEDFTLEYSIYKNIFESKKEENKKHFKKKDLKKLRIKLIKL